MVKTNDKAFRYYFWFMQERMNLFWRKFNKERFPWTDDQTLMNYKFTNVYRACDRVSQYLIREVIYSENASDFSSTDVLLRILVFKVFNKIDTWKYIEERLGEPLVLANYNPRLLTQWLSELQNIQAIFNGAYIMTGSHSDYTNYKSKHERWLYMIQTELINKEGFQRILQANTLEEVYEILLQCPFIGSFLAYQYAIDFNYSTVLNFDENSFVKAGIGAQRGIKKCFDVDKKYQLEYYIQHTQDQILTYRSKYGFNNFKSLFGREPTLIDLQNCFCETDKLLRVKLPSANLGNTRIKQKYRAHRIAINYFFPPKWGLTYTL
jgi:hypothetical protein